MSLKLKIFCCPNNWFFRDGGKDSCKGDSGGKATTIIIMHREISNPKLSSIPCSIKQISRYLFLLLLYSRSPHGPTEGRKVCLGWPGVCRLLMRQARTAWHLPSHLRHGRLDIISSQRWSRQSRIKRESLLSLSFMTSLRFIVIRWKIWRFKGR